MQIFQRKIRLLNNNFCHHLGLSERKQHFSLVFRSLIRTFPPT